MNRPTQMSLLSAVVALSLAAASPAGARVPTFKGLSIVPGVSIGAVKVGMSKAKAVAVWGKPDKCSADQYKTTTCEYRPNGPFEKDSSSANYQVAEFELRSGKVITVAVITTPNTAVAEARRAKLGRGAVTLMRDSAAVPEAGIFEGTLEPPARYRRKLRRLKRLKTTLSLACSSAGKTGRDRTKITFKR